MPSWSPSNKPEAPPKPSGTNAATAIARARRLLEQLFSGRRSEDAPEEPPALREL